ncbi:hypothetical protein FRC03_001739 [Tulasnella sp. 419]|nr:hypothetical protein FRC03_001739 [Tulasnella sp. 419]
MMNFFKKKSKKPKAEEEEASKKKPVKEGHGKPTLPGDTPLALAKQQADEQVRQNERTKEKGLPKFEEFEFGKSNKKKEKEKGIKPDTKLETRSADGHDTLRPRSTANTKNYGRRSSNNYPDLETSPPRPASAAYIGRYNSPQPPPGRSNENYERNWDRDRPESRGYHRNGNWDGNQPPYPRDDYRAHTPSHDGHFPERHSFSYAGEYQASGSYYDQRRDPFPSLYQPTYAPPSPRPDPYNQPPRPVSRQGDGQLAPYPPNDPMRPTTPGRGPPSPQRYGDPYHPGHARSATWDESYYASGPPPPGPRSPSPYLPSHSTGAYSSYAPSPHPPYGGDAYSSRHSVYSHSTGLSYMSGGVPPPPPPPPMTPVYDDRRYSMHSPYPPPSPHGPQYPYPYDRQSIAPQHTAYSSYHGGQWPAPYPDPRMGYGRHGNEGLPNPHDPSYRPPPSPIAPHRELDDDRKPRADGRGRGERDSRQSRQYSESNESLKTGSELVKRKPPRVVEAEQKRQKEQDKSVNAGRLSIYHTPSFSRSRESFDFSPVTPKLPELEPDQPWERNQGRDDRSVRNEHSSWTDTSQGGRRVESPESMHHQQRSEQIQPPVRPYSRNYERSTTPYSDHRSVSEYDHSAYNGRTSTPATSEISSYNANNEDVFGAQHDRLYHLGPSNTRPNLNVRQLPAPSPQPQAQSRRHQTYDTRGGAGVIEDGSGQADSPAPVSGPIADPIVETKSSVPVSGASSSTPSHQSAATKRTKTISPRGPRVRSRSVSAALADAQAAL